MTNTQDNAALPNDTRFEDALKQASKLGAMSVMSALAKPNLAIEMVRGVVDNFIDTEEKYEQHLDSYFASRAKATAKNTLTQGLKEDNEASMKSQRSKQRQIYEMALLPAIDPVALLNEVTDRRTALIAGDVKVKPAYDAYVDVARAQKKQPLEQLTGDILDKIITKPEAGEKDIIAKLVDEYKRTYKLAEKMAEDMLDTTHIEAARDALSDAISALDGEVPSMTKESKKDDEMVGFLMAKGYTKAQARDIVASKK